MTHLILDIGGVLVYPRLGEWHIPYRAAEILGPARAATLGTPAFRAAHAESFHWLDESRIVGSVEEERALRGGFVRELDRRMNWRMTADEIARMTDDFTDDIDRYGFFDDLEAYLPVWSREYALSILSDTMPSMLGFLGQRGLLGYFRETVISTRVGATKPSPRMYRAALEALGAAPGDCLFVDDRLENLQGALDAGMRAIQMSRPEFPAAVLWDGPVARDFGELDRLMKEGAP